MREKRTTRPASRPFALAAALWLAATGIHAQSPSDNYVRTTLMLDSAGTRTRVSVDYYDGMGRPVQHVTGSPVPGRAVHVSRTYNARGLLAGETLPAPVQQEGRARVGKGSLASALLSQYGDSMAHTLHSYDALGRETSSRGPGAAWTAHPRTTAFGTNSATEVRRLTADGGTLRASGCYPAGSLSRETVTDEQGRRTVTYTDLAGNVVMAKTGTDDMTEVYYVRDGRGRLRFVVPSAALHALYGGGPWDADTPALAQYAYTYEYDAHGRVTGRRLPGCAWSRSWYDRDGRVAYEDDGNLRASGRRRFFLYDHLNRLVVSGTCKASTAPDMTWGEAKAKLFSGSDTYAGYKTGISLDSVELHGIDYYDNYVYVRFGLGQDGSWLAFTPVQGMTSRHRRPTGRTPIPTPTRDYRSTNTTKTAT